MCLAAFTSEPQACECLEPLSVATEFSESIFVGIVEVSEGYVAPEITNTATNVTAEVLRSWKGARDVLVFVSRGSMCAPELVPNRRYLLFLKDNNGVPTLTGCGMSMAYKRWFPSQVQRRTMAYLKTTSHDLRPQSQQR